MSSNNAFTPIRVYNTHSESYSQIVDVSGTCETGEMFNASNTQNNITENNYTEMNNSYPDLPIEDKFTIEQIFNGKSPDEILSLLWGHHDFMHELSSISEGFEKQQVDEILHTG
jgi:hypothetical protein